MKFKENVSDPRNVKVVDIIEGSRSHSLDVDVRDPLVDADEAAHKVAIKPCGIYHRSLAGRGYSVFRSIVVAVTKLRCGRIDLAVSYNSRHCKLSIYLP